MKRKSFIIFAMVMLLLVGCSSNEVPQTETSTVRVTELETETETESVAVLSLPENFVEATPEQLQGLPDRDDLLAVVPEVLGLISVKDVQKVVYGNYREDDNTFHLINLDVYAITDTEKNLLVKAMYLETSSNSSWSVISVTNAVSGLYYYVQDDLKNKCDIYDYTTGKLISEKTEDMGDSVKECNEKSEKIESEFSEQLDDLKEKYTESESETQTDTEAETQTETQADIESNEEGSSNSKVSEMQFEGEYITDVAARDMEEYDYITDITIVVDESKREINIAVQIPSDTNEDTAKMAGEDVARYLASMASWVNSDYKAPGSTDIGGIYDKYDLKLYLDDGFGSIDIWGAKVTYSNRITWN